MVVGGVHTSPVDGVMLIGLGAAGGVAATRKPVGRGIDTAAVVARFGPLF